MNKSNISSIKYEAFLFARGIGVISLQHVFRTEMMEYESEGIIAEALTFTDNQSLLVTKKLFIEVFQSFLPAGTFHGEATRHSDPTG